MKRTVVAAAAAWALSFSVAQAGTPTASRIVFSDPILRPGAPQTVTVIARDLKGTPLAGARVFLTLHLGSRVSYIHMRVTDIRGTTSVTLHPSATLRGTRVTVSATISTPSLTVPLTSSFMVARGASAAAGTHTPTPTATHPANTPTPAAPRTPTKTSTQVTVSSSAGGALTVAVHAAPAGATAPDPIWVVVTVQSNRGQILIGVPVQATAAFDEGVVAARGTTDSGGAATLRIDTGAARANQTVHVTASATWQGQTVFGSAEVPLTVPVLPTATPTLIPTPTFVPTPALSSPVPTATPQTAPAVAPTGTQAPTVTPIPTLTAVPTATAPPTAVPTPTSPTSCSGDTCVNAMLTVLNQTRAQYGLYPLSLDLVQTNGNGSCVGSIGHSEAMQESGSIWHDNPAYPAASFPSNLCVRYSSAGENVGSWPGANEMSDLISINNLMMSEPHDAATCAVEVNHACSILSTTYQRVGIGIVYADGSAWLTEDFIG